MKQQHYNFQLHSIHRKPPLKISHINLYHCQSPVNNFLNAHIYPKMIFAYKGSAYLTVDNQRLLMTENELFLMNQGSIDYSIEPTNSTVDFCVVGFEDIEFIFSEEERDSDYAHYNICDDESQLFVKKIVEELTQDQLYFQHACDYYMNMLFIQLQRHNNLKYRIITKEKANKDCEFIRNYLDEHYAENITLDTLASESKMNKYYLVHSFTNNYGCSPINYLNEKKIDESKILLETTNYSIAEIAEMIGFSSQSYFSQSFKKHTYMTPNEYRRSTKQR